METAVKKPFIDYNDAEKWREGLNAMRDGATVEMCVDSYWHFLGCVPPIVQEGSAFMNSEPYCHNSKDEEVCLCGIERNGKYYAQLGTYREFKNRSLFKTI